MGIIANLCRIRKKERNDRFQLVRPNYFDNLYDAVNNVDGVVVMTEWNEFRSLDLKKIKSKMSGNIFLDTRNIISMEELSSVGFIYDNVGRIKK